MRLDVYLKLSRLVPRRSGAKQLCDDGGVRVNGQLAKAGREVRPGDLITLFLPSREITTEVLALPGGRSVAKSAARELFRVVAERRYDLFGNELPQGGQEPVLRARPADETPLRKETCTPGE